jgi:dynein heavy chain 1
MTELHNKDIDLTSIDDLTKFIDNLVQISSQDHPINIDRSLINKFINNHNHDTIYLIKLKHGYDMINELVSVQPSFIIVKPKGKLLADVPLGDQLSIINVPSCTNDESYNTSIENLQDLIKLGLSSYFDLITTNEFQSNSNLIVQTKKKFQELSLSLQHLQQRIQVPNLLLSVHPKILALINEYDDTIVKNLIEDSQFLNELSSIVNHWIKEIQSITSLNHDPFDNDSILDEIQFWKSMETALISINSQINLPEVTLSLDILSRAKRFHITLSFQNDTGLNDKLTQSKLYNSVLREIPIEDLATISFESDVLDKIVLATNAIFNHLKIKLKNSTTYPVSRSLQLVELLVAEVVNKVAAILPSYSLLSSPLSTFVEIQSLVYTKVFETLDHNINSMVNTIREMIRKRQEKFMVVKISHDLYNKLKERFHEMNDLLVNHHQLLSLMEVFEQSNTFDQSRSLADAYNKFILPVEAFDISVPGEKIWLMNVTLYNQVSKKCVSFVVSKLNDLFSDCTRFSDFLIIFNKFRFVNAETTNSFLQLISDDYKLQILTEAEKELNKITELHSTTNSRLFDSIASLGNFNKHVFYSQQDSVVAVLKYNISLVSKVEFYIQSLQRLLGLNWNKYSLGIRIDQKISTFMKILDTNKVFDDWLSVQTSRIMNLQKGGPAIKIIQTGKENNFDLVLNFDFSLVQVSQDLPDLSCLGFKVPVSLLIQFKKVDKIYPLIVGLLQHIKILKSVVNSQVDLDPGFAFALENQKLKVIDALGVLLQVDWVYLGQAIDLSTLRVKESSFSENSLEILSLKSLNKFQEEVHNLYTQTNKILKFNDSLLNSLSQLKECPYDRKWIEPLCQQVTEEISTVLSVIPEIAVELNNEVNHRVEAILLAKCEYQLSIFADKIRLQENKVNEFENLENLPTKLGPPVSFIGTLEHSIITKDQLFDVSPPFADSRKALFENLNNLISTIEQQPLIGTSNDYSGYRLSKSNRALNIVSSILKDIDAMFYSGDQYLSKWKLLQSIWELDLNRTDDLNRLFLHANPELLILKETLLETIQLGTVFDNSESYVSLANDFLRINFIKVQASTSLKFDRFKKQLLAKLAETLQGEITDLTRTLNEAKGTLSAKLDIHSQISKVVANLDNYLTYKNRLQEWHEKSFLFKQCQIILHKQRFNFLAEWTYTEQLESTILSIESLLLSKEKTIEENREILVSKIVAEENRVNDSIETLLQEWESKKHLSRALNPLSSIKTLVNFEDLFSNLAKSSGQVTSILKSMNAPMAQNHDLDSIIDEIKVQKSAWSSINTLWEEVERIKSFKWNSVPSREIRQSLDSSLSLSRSFSSSIRQYSSFDEIQGEIKLYLKTFHFIQNLKSESMKPRHWRALLKQLGKQEVAYESLTLGDVWNLNFTLNDTVINEMLLRANNEQTIEDNLNNITRQWSKTTFEMFTHETKYRLIKNWETLFDQCNTDINTLSSMRNSSYFGAFEQEVSELEVKLNTLYVILDTWIDVQQQWLYLNGVFGNQSNEIQVILPTESVRFTNVSYEFSSVMKRALKVNIVMDVVHITDFHKNLEKILGSLSKVQKSLADYLEKQRELFPRFYFVGNEDLLEIIGSSTNVEQINKHFKKMFMGISSVNYEQESSSIVSVCSEQGECLKLAQPILLTKHPRLNEWLSQLELEVKLTLASLTQKAVARYDKFLTGNGLDSIDNVVVEFPSQVCVLASQVCFTKFGEQAIQEKKVTQFRNRYVDLIKALSENIHSIDDYIERKKIEHLIIESLHQRNILDRISDSKSDLETQHIWNMQQLFYLKVDAQSLLQSLKIKHANSEFYYGFEYLGVPEKLAYTPLIDKCFLTMTQALEQKHGGSPFGPAGTGKTEAIKALGNNLGKMVLVFCCDEFFDYQSMGRIFLGLCKVGAWGCFDEFNRLDEKILSAISSQIETIEHGLANPDFDIEISGKLMKLNPETGIFVTMNPDYAGRSELPENLKKLFRSFAMTNPDRETIAEVLLSSQAFKSARELSTLIVPLFLELETSTTKQSHYDFGLRALKCTLNRCGDIRRGLSNTQSKEVEFLIVLQSIDETIRPKLILNDEKILDNLEQKYFPGIEYDTSDTSEFLKEVEKYTSENGLDLTETWKKKVLQLQHIQGSHNGIVLVGKSGTGKSTVYRLVLSCLSKMDGTESLSFVIDCKVLSKEQIYGSLDLVTRDWTDGLFTGLLRRIIGNLRGELSKRVWIIFDGDIDPEWAENLNSVLDDNKLLTLPNGERLSLPPNVRLIFEVDNLNHATPATITRCGMVWFDSPILSIGYMLRSLLNDTQHVTVDLNNDIASNPHEAIEHQRFFVESAIKIIDVNLINKVFNEALNYTHVMELTINRAMSSFVTLLKTYYRKFVQFFVTNQDINPDHLLKYIQKAILLSMIWSLAGDMDATNRNMFASYLAKLECFTSVEEVNTTYSILDYDISLPKGDWVHWIARIESLDLEPHHVNPNTVVPTIDTVRNESMIYSILNEHKPVILCGPPGSGKTMTLLGALRKSPGMDLISLNFSKETSPKSLMKSLEQYCDYKKSSTGMVLEPRISGKWVVVFCDEINLPEVDKYGTQRVISLIRQMIEHGGFWDAKKHCWISLLNIQFVGACNPPEDPGRNVLSERFLRHVSLLMVDHPGEMSLRQIYKSFNLAVMKYAPDLRGFTDSVTNAMIDVYLETKLTISASLQNHYIYSPRELTRWSIGLREAMKSSDYLEFSSLARLWYHEGMRLFYDRLVGDWERNWTKALFERVISTHFPNIDTRTTLKEPIYFSNWLSLGYESVDELDLTLFISERFKVFSEEEVEVDFILHENLLDYALRIDRVLRQEQGHMILVGPCTSGKTTLSKFVAWMNGLKVIQLRVSRNYGIEQFDESLRDILLRCARGEKICFIIDESSIMETTFIERMNTLLANSEIPGLFEDDNYKDLMNLCIEQSQMQGLLIDSESELYSWFSSRVSQNLHVIFNISSLNLSNRPQVVSSPALFNRCVLSWMGDWSIESLVEIATKLLEPVPMDSSMYQIPTSFKPLRKEPVTNFKEVLVDTIIYIHSLVWDNNIKVLRVPKQFLEFIFKLIEIFNKKQFELEENQRHVSTGLDKLRESVIEMNKLKEELSIKLTTLKEKDDEARLMLNKMLTEQNEAERKQEFSVATQTELEKQEREIEKRKSTVLRELELAEPAVVEAQKGVQNIKKQHLTEIRSMSNPPAAVKMTMESVCILLGYNATNWKEVQLIVRRDDFIPNIVSFDSDTQLTPELRTYMERTYLSREDYTYEVVYRASKACGPLVQWVVAQLRYSKILQQVGPLRDEVKILENQTMKTRAQLIAIQQMIEELETSIDKYKEDYSELIREAEKIKSEMKMVETKINRSTKLIDNLTTERQRWKESIDRFGSQRQQLIGDSLVAAAFVVYCGVHDQKDRLSFTKLVQSKLESAAIKFDKALTIEDSLSRGREIINWKDNGLGQDSLNIENFIIFKHSNFPLIIDPSNSIVEVITNIERPKKVVVTSFLDTSFVKQLENAIRFGGTIIIQDAEYYDPLLDSILREEIQRNGGRSVIFIGERPIDYSKNFKLVMHTLDPKIILPPFVASRTKVINFSITTGSLENKVLDLTLQEMRPKVEEKRREVMSLNGEYYARLHALEEELLSLLSVSDGNILDDDTLFDTLESLKAESTQVDYKISDTLEVLNTVEQTRNEYSELATHSSSIYSTLLELNHLSNFYNFSLSEFVSIFVAVLKSCQKDCSSVDIASALYKEVYANIAPSLTYIHRIVFALMLKLDFWTNESTPMFKNAFLLLILAISDNLPENSMGLTIGHILGSDVEAHVSRSEVEALLNNSIHPHVKELKYLILSLVDSDTKINTVMDAFARLTEYLFSGNGWFTSRYNLEYWIDQVEHLSIKSILIVSPKGIDPTLRIEGLANQMNAKVVLVSMGSKEGIDNANKQLEVSSTQGNWLILQNIQMSPEWINSIESKLETMSYNPGFKLFLTCSTTSSVPTGLITKSKVLTFENHLGLKASIMGTFRSIPNEKFEQSSGIMKHIYFLLVIYHSIISERLRYCPIAFSKNYDINDSDFEVGTQLISKLMGSNTISPVSVNWHQISYLISEIVYGAKIDNAKDLQYFVDLGNYLFSPESLELDFNLIKNELTDAQGDALLIPEGTTTAAYVEWVDSLPSDISLSWINLPEEINILLKEKQTEQVAKDLTYLHKDSK